MADVNAPSGQTPTMAPPVRADDQILPHIRWVPIGKSNCYLDLEKSQSNPIYKIAVDLLQNANFFRAFTASSTIPSIYIQQFWNTILYDKKAGCYKCQLDEQWFNLTKETLREALQITPVNHNHAFTAPPSIDGLIDFVNQLGYPKLVMNLSNVVTNDLFQPWRALLTIINLCLTGKTSGFERPRAPRKHRFHPRLDSPLHLSNEEPVLGYLKFSAKGTKSEVFGMPIPDSLITADIQQATYYREYQAKATETTDKPAKAKRIKHSISCKTRQPRSSPKYVGFGGKLGKGKAKVSEEKVAHDLLSLQKHKKTSLADQYIFQRRVSEPTGSFGHDESPYALLGQSDNEEESEKVVLGAEKGGQDEGQAGPDPDAQAEDQTGLDADPGDAEAKVQSISTLVVHAGSDREHMDLDVANVSPQPSTEQLDEGFTATVYPNVQENLKLAVEEPIPESPKEHQQLKATTTDTTTTTTTMLPPPHAPQQSTTEAMLVKRIGELEHIMDDLIQVNKNMEERLDSHGSRLYTLEQLDISQWVSIAVSEVVTDAVDWAMQAPLRNRFRDLPEADMKEILHQRMWESDSYKSHEDHMQLFEALEKSMNRDHSKELVHLLLHQRVHSELRGLLELLDQLKCHHHHLHLHPPIKKVRPKALLHQVHQRQLPQLNIKPGRRLT
uniref:Monodehydroascorbate reductase n=1 Tax=Tanacetum cinerariifolium TaxID=118510 RepID=A0A6L2JE74_TANCI|nr:monodehydroascorbate reductase [Tanacetum cinerariifolium]